MCCKKCIVAYLAHQCPLYWTSSQIQQHHAEPTTLKVKWELIHCCPICLYFTSKPMLSTIGQQTKIRGVWQPTLGALRVNHSLHQLNRVCSCSIKLGMHWICQLHHAKTRKGAEMEFTNLMTKCKLCLSHNRGLADESQWSFCKPGSSCWHTPTSIHCARCSPDCPPGQGLSAH